ncbi:hypothetical protein BIY22_04010 [Vibrio panuliri]|uniref:Ribosome recycling factor n=1 Tax=Vibrio panuliri TaxID=1381081 RepID=A0A1Q9HIK9_9VIBR|nr:ribosome recycling factor family protein [Vibrio panuliri]OLQ90175.1 hypothetical protein BIY22_04010 [Vibrio panuliri]
MPNERYSISLPSFIHRVGREQSNVTRALATQFGCELKRVRRSRNWLLVGDYSSLSELLVGLRIEDSLAHQFTINKLSVALARIEPPVTLEQQLAQLLNNNPNITLAEMMEVTGCDITDARKARFESDTL